MPRAKKPESTDGTKVDNRPRKYKPEFAQMILDYFDQPNTKEVPVVIQTRGGGTLTKTETQALPPRHLTAFARSIGVHVNTLRIWADQHPEFGEAYAWAKDMICEQIVDCGVLGVWNAQFTKLYAVNATDMRDKTAVDVTSEGRALAPTVSVVPPPEPVKGE